MRYFYCRQLDQYYRIEDTPKKTIYAYESEKKQWTEVPITQSAQGTNCYEYTLNIGIENAVAILREADIHTITNYLTLEITIWSNQSLFGKTQYLQWIEISLQYIQAQKPELLKDSKPCTKTNSQQQLHKISKNYQSFFAENNQEDKHYDLSEKQRGALEAHRETLKSRWTEYHFLSYLFFCFSCFSTGFSKTEKIAEITRLLDTGIATAEVVEQGYTGSIVLGGSV